MMNVKPIVILIVVGLIVAAGIAAAVALNKGNESTPGELEDHFGNTFTLSKKVERSVVEAGAALRFTTYMGDKASETVVGTSSTYSFGTGVNQYSYVYDFSPAATLGAFTSSVEEIIALNPDIVIIGYVASSLPNDVVSFIKTLKAAGIPTCVVKYLDDFTQDDYKEQLRLMGKVFDTEDIAEKLISETDNILEDLGQRMSAVTDPVGVYVGGVKFSGIKDFLWTNVSYGGFMYLGSKIVNIAVKINPSATYQVATDWERIYNFNGDIDAVFVDLAGYELVKNQWNSGESKFRVISAINDGNFYYVLPQTNNGTCHDNTLVAAYVIGSILFPEQFGDVNIEETAKKIFAAFNGGSEEAGEAVYNGMVGYIQSTNGVTGLGGKIAF
jgi:iron complex transport system substrate-binding protein